MIVVSLRQSLIGSYKSWCGHQVALQNNFGLQNYTGKSALLGCVYHRVMQLRADQKIAIQNGKDEWDDEDLGIITVSDAYDLDKYIDIFYDHYINGEYDKKNKDRFLNTLPKIPIDKWIVTGKQ